jgi:hypothetical protein
MATNGKATAGVSPLVSLFKQQLENECRQIAGERQLTRRGDFLTWWYFLRLMGFDDAQITEIMCDGPNDLGIDAIFIDDDEVVHFYQFKNPESPDAGFPAGEVDKVLAGLNLILSRGHAGIANAELRGRVEEIYQTVAAAYRLHLVTTGRGLCAESIAKLKAFVVSLQGPEEFFTWVDEDLKWLQDRFYQKSLPTVETPIEFVLDQPPYAVRSADHNCWMFHVSAGILGELYGKHGEQLLQQNIRIYQGDRGTNAAIRKTCTGEDSANFLHYNNGVTFLCDTAPWDPFTRKLILHKAQVVNGGQTVRVINAAQREGTLQGDVLVPMRVITSQGDKGFASNVAVNLNNQNRIEPSFLRSNDPRILQLANALASLGWYLERREGEVRNLTEVEQRAIETRIGYSLNDHMIRLKQATQAYVATFLRQPELAKKNPKRMFLSGTDGGVFEKIFSTELTVEKYVQAQRLAWAVEAFIKQFMTRKRRKDRVENWRTDYSVVLGAPLVDQYGEMMDQVVPQSAIFLAALAYEDWVRIRGLDIRDLLSVLEKGDVQTFRDYLDLLIRCAGPDKTAASSWPTLLKSQVFFENVASYVKGVREREQKGSPGVG